VCGFSYVDENRLQPDSPSVSQAHHALFDNASSIAVFVHSPGPRHRENLALTKELVRVLHGPQNGLLAFEHGAVVDGSMFARKSHGRGETRHIDHALHLQTGVRCLDLLRPDSQRWDGRAPRSLFLTTVAYAIIPSDYHSFVNPLRRCHLANVSAILRILFYFHCLRQVCDNLHCPILFGCGFIVPLQGSWYA
jgi:hypothetical protein